MRSTSRLKVSVLSLAVPAAFTALSLGCYGPWKAKPDSVVTQRDVVYSGHQPILTLDQSEPNRTRVAVAAQARCRLVERGEVYQVEQRSVELSPIPLLMVYAVVSAAVSAVGIAFWSSADSGSDEETLGMQLAIPGLAALGVTALIGSLVLPVETERRDPVGRSFARWASQDLPCETVSAGLADNGHLGARIEDDAEGHPVVTRVSPGFAADGLLQVGDRVLRVRKMPIASAAGALASIGSAGVGGATEVTVLRAGTEQVAALTLPASPDTVGKLLLKRLEAEQEAFLPALGLPNDEPLEGEALAHAKVRLIEVLAGQDPAAFAR